MRSQGWRVARLGGLILGGTLAGVAAIIAPTLAWLLPQPIRQEPSEWFVGALAVAYGLARWSAARGPRPELTARLDRLSARAAEATGRPLDVAVAWACGLMLATWVPHYLTWPWWRDLDTFATLAQAWDAGIAPYRDALAYNFPGQIYLFWLLGKALGWGRTVAFNAVDAGFVVGLGWALVRWSRARFGRALPGLIGYLPWLWYYLTIQFTLVAQRDWHGPFCAALALLAAEAWPGRSGRVASALVFAAAVTFRPHVVVFLPAIASAVDETARPEGGARTRSARSLVGWALALLGFLLLAATPLLLSGIADDFARSLRRVAAGAHRGTPVHEGFAATLLGQLRAWRVDAVLGACLLMALVGPPGRRRLARTWALALLGALMYRPLHVVTTHAYLGQPLILMTSLALAAPAAWLLEAPRLAPIPRLLAVAWVMMQAVPDIPFFCSVEESLRALPALARGEDPPRTPPGCEGSFPRRPLEYMHYEWADYRATLAYLRRATGPDTRVANVLRYYPYPSLNGPTGRLSPFRAESGLLWMLTGYSDEEARFVAELDRSADSVVVWEPDGEVFSHRLDLPRLIALIRAEYEPEARLGAIEVWRRRPRAAQPSR